jgi:TsgA-like MFS transporter
VNKRLLTLASYLGYFFIGLISIVLSPSLPFMIKDFNISLAAAGAAFTTGAAGSFFGVFVGGILSDLLGKKPFILLGCLVQGAAMAIIAATNSWLVALLLFVLKGIAGGALSTSLNALVAEINVERRGAAMNTLHGIYGIGSLIGPVIVGLAFTLQFGWRFVFYGAASLWILFLFLIAAMPFPTDGPKDISNKQAKLPVRSFLFHPVFILLFFVSFIYNGAATSLVGWINTYMDVMQFSVFLGSGMVTVFYIGLTLGRFLCGMISDRAGFSRIILICSLGSLLFYPLAVFTQHPILIAAGIFLSGFFFSGLHPTGLAYANKLFPTAAGTITGTLSTAMSLGAMVVPWLTGLIADKSGFQAGLGLGFALLLVLAGISIHLFYTEKKTNDKIEKEGFTNDRNS